MPDQPLKQLLQQADRSIGHAPLITTDPAEWANLVAMRKRRRDRVRYSAAGSSALAAIVLVALLLTRAQLSNDPAKPLEVVAKLPVTLPEITADRQLDWQVEASVRRRVARRLLAIQHQRANSLAVSAKLHSPTSNPIADALRLAEEAPLIMVVQADRMVRDLGLRRSSIQAYRRTMELFPRSPYAAVAKGRLAALQSQYNGGTL